MCIINVKAMDYWHRMMQRLRWVFSLAHSALDSGANCCGEIAKRFEAPVCVDAKDVGACMD